MLRIFRPMREASGRCGHLSLACELVQRVPRDQLRILIEGNIKELIAKLGIVNHFPRLPMRLQATNVQIDGYRSKPDDESTGKDSLDTSMPIVKLNRLENCDDENEATGDGADLLRAV